MRSRASVSVILALFALLAAGSVGLKAAAGPAPDGTVDARPRLVETQVESRLHAQGFSTEAQVRSNRSELIVARRGNCVLAARDARGGASFASLFAADTRRIGSVRYLYRGGSYDTPPAVQFRIGRLQNELLGRLGLRHSSYVPIALSATTACGDGSFGLDRIRVPT